MRELLVLLLVFQANAGAEVQSCVQPIVGGNGVVAAVPPPIPRTTLQIMELDISREGAILEILHRFSDLRNHINGYSDKNSKKEFVLGQILEAGYSVEVTYELDARGGHEPTFHLASVDSIDPSGHKVNLTKKPFDDQNVLQQIYNYDGPNGTYLVKFPPHIEGSVLEEAIKWGKRLEYLSPADLSKVSSLADLKYLYFTYFKKSQIDLHMTGVLKGYSKILFNVATFALFTYFTLKRNAADDKPNHSDLFLLLLNFKGTRIEGLESTRKLIGELEKTEQPILSKDFIDPEPRPGRTRVITVSEYSGVMTVVETTYEGGKAIDASAIVVPREEGIFKVLARGLRAK